MQRRRYRYRYRAARSSGAAAAEAAAPPDFKALPGAGLAARRSRSGSPQPEPTALIARGEAGRGGAGGIHTSRPGMPPPRLTPRLPRRRPAAASRFPGFLRGGRAGRGGGGSGTHASPPRFFFSPPPHRQGCGWASRLERGFLLQKENKIALSCVFRAVCWKSASFALLVPRQRKAVGIRWARCTAGTTAHPNLPPNPRLGDSRARGREKPEEHSSTWVLDVWNHDTRFPGLGVADDTADSDVWLCARSLHAQWGHLIVEPT